MTKWYYNLSICSGVAPMKLVSSQVTTTYPRSSGVNHHAWFSGCYVHKLCAQVTCYIVEIMIDCNIQYSLGWDMQCIESIIIYSVYLMSAFSDRLVLRRGIKAQGVSLMCLIPKFSFNTGMNSDIGHVFNPPVPYKIKLIEWRGQEKRYISLVATVVKTPQKDMLNHTSAGVWWYL